MREFDITVTECADCAQETSTGHLKDGRVYCDRCFHADHLELSDDDERDWRMNPTEDELRDAEGWIEDYQRRRDAEMEESA